MARRRPAIVAVGSSDGDDGRLPRGSGSAGYDPDSSTSTRALGYYQTIGGRPMSKPISVPNIPMNMASADAAGTPGMARVWRSKPARSPDSRLRHNTEMRSASPRPADHDADHDLLQVGEQMGAADQFRRELAERIAVGDEEPFCARVASGQFGGSTPANADQTREERGTCRSAGRRREIRHSGGDP